MSRVVPLLVAAGACACLLNACSNDDPTALELGSVPVPTVPSTAAASSVATTSSTSAADPATTEPAPTTSISPEDQVKADFLADMAIRRQCSYDPVACDYLAIAVPNSPMDRFLRETMAGRINNGLRLVGKDTSTIVILSVRLQSDSLAQIATCIFDPVVMYDIADPDAAGDDVIFDDNAYSIRSTWSLSRTAIGWRIFEGTATEQTVGDSRCAA